MASAYITEDGTLHVVATSDMERYALRKWREGYNVIADGQADSALSIETEDKSLAQKAPAGTALGLRDT